MAGIRVVLALDGARIPHFHVCVLVLRAAASSHIQRLESINTQNPQVHPVIGIKRMPLTFRVVGNQALENDREQSKFAVTSVRILLWG
jgi:hypothetical protein